tara:strand:+ start:637 stop:1056 length:420 start_codon:yes stop_codon:yes gene_type:complete
MNLQVTGIFETLDTFMGALETGAIDWYLLFGREGGGTGLVVQNQISQCKKNTGTGGNGQKVLMRTYSGESERVEGIADPVQYLVTAAAGVGLTLVLYSTVPCYQDENGIYHASGGSWDDSALPQLSVELSKDEWQDPTE